MPQVRPITKQEFERLRNGDWVFDNPIASLKSRLIVTRDDPSSSWNKSSNYGMPYPLPVSNIVIAIKTAWRNGYHTLEWRYNAEESTPTLWVVVPTEEDIEAVVIGYALTATSELPEGMLQGVKGFWLGDGDWVGPYGFNAVNDQLKDICKAYAQETG